MFRIFNTALTALILLFVLALAAKAEQPDVNAENTEQVIAHLVEELGRSHLIFIRNGVRYSSEEAVKHILKKYHYFKSQIESPEDFIRLCASKSLVSGNPYIVATLQGNVTMKIWLGQILMEYRSTKGIQEQGLQ